MNRSYFCEKL